MSKPEEEDDLPDDKDLSRPGAGNDEVHEQGNGQDSDGGFLVAREGATSLVPRQPGLLAHSIENQTVRGRYKK